LGASVELVDNVPDLVVTGDEESEIQRIEELRPDEDALLNMTLAGLKMSDEMAVMAMISEKIMGYASQALEEWKKRKSEGYKLFVLDQGVKRKRDQEEDELYERLGKIEEEYSNEGLEKRYAEAYEKLKKAYIVEDIELDLENAVEESMPKSWKQAMKSKNRVFWLKACCEEICAIARMGVFIITRDIPVGKRTLPAKWVFSTKKNVQTGKILKFKARWVARGDLQKKGVDYKETFTPVASLTTLRILLQLIASEDLELDQMDVVSAFLNGSIDMLVFLMQPEGFDLGGGVCCLLKSIYGMC